MPNYYGTNESDTIFGSSGDDAIWGYDGDDVLIGGAGADIIDGGAGFDLVSYADLAVGVVVNLMANANSDGDMLTSVEALVGSNFDDELNGLDTGSYLAGGAGNDSLAGGAGQDTFEGGDGNDVVWAGAANDTVYGNGGDDQLSGGSGDDLLNGGAGADVLQGGDGYDIASYAEAVAPVVVSLVTGVADDGDTLLSIEGLIGSAGNDTLTGDAGANIIDGGLGADMIDGGDSFDTVTYASRDTSVSVDLATGVNTDGDTLLSIEALIGGSADDTLVGDANGNVLDGGWGADLLDGGGGNDYVSYAARWTPVAANLANGTNIDGDVFVSIENLIGGWASDLLTGNTAVNHLQGGSGDDILDGGLGGDLLDGGVGMDIVSYADRDVDIVVDLSMGTNPDNDIFTSIEGVVGGAGHDFLIGDAGDNYLAGGAGANYLQGGLGADILDGQGGVGIADYSERYTGVYADLLSGSNTDGDQYISINSVRGGYGADEIHGDDGINYFFDMGGGDVFDGRGGWDLLSHWGRGDALVINLTTGINTDGDTYISIESLEGGNNNDTLIGNTSANDLAGGMGDDYLSGEGGNDTLQGQSGADIIDGGSGNDTAVYGHSTAGVSIDLASGMTSGGHADGDVLISIESLSGSYHDDVLSGDAGNNVLSGRDGNDVLDGRAGNDVIHGGNGADIATGGSGADRFVYKELSESGITLSDQDIYLDFIEADGDRLDLRSIAANEGTLTYIGTDAFSGMSGEIRAWASTSVLGFTHIGLDVDGDTVADMIFMINGDPVDISAAAFML